MNLATIQFSSPTLMRTVTYTAILPNDQQGPAPVVLQLHGYFGTHTDWLYASNLLRHAASYPFIIVLPSGENSWYQNLNPAMRYETFIVQDLWEHVHRTFQVRSGPWAIGGLSMGGYGALRLGCKYPGQFASIYAHSSAFPVEGEEPPVFFGEDPNVYDVVERMTASAGRPVIGFDCGTEDQFIQQNRRMHGHLEKLGVAHTYAEYPGGHTWDYWDAHVPTALAQHARVLLG